MVFSSLAMGARGQVAQLVEHRTENPGVAGSIPALSTSRRVFREAACTPRDATLRAFERAQRDSPVLISVATIIVARCEDEQLAKSDKDYARAQASLEAPDAASGAASGTIP